jgi:proteasome alpha subunit
MPFYVSPEQAMKDKADYARKGIARGRSGVVIQYDAGILFVAPNPSRALHKISEIYDRIAFAAVGRYNEYEILRKAGVRYADMTGYQYDRQDVTARGLANWYAQTLGTIFTDSPKPFEVEIVVAEAAEVPAEDQIYRITFDGSVAEEHGYVAMGGQAEAIATVLKDSYAEAMSLPGALAVAIAALAGQGNGDRPEITASQLEVAVLDRARPHRTFRRLTGNRLENLLAEVKPGSVAAGTGAAGTGAAAGSEDASAKAQPGSAPAGTASKSGRKPAARDAGTADAGTADAGTADAGTAGAESAGTKPSESKPGGTKPGGVKPGGVKPGGTEPGGTEPGEAEAGQAEPGGSGNGDQQGQAGPESAGTDGGQAG